MVIEKHLAFLQCYSNKFIYQKNLKFFPGDSIHHYYEIITLNGKIIAWARSAEASTMYQGEHVSIDDIKTCFTLHDASVTYTYKQKLT